MFAEACTALIWPFVMNAHSSPFTWDAHGFSPAVGHLASYPLVGCDVSMSSFRIPNGIACSVRSWRCQRLHSWQVCLVNLPCPVVTISCTALSGVAVLFFLRLACCGERNSDVCVGMVPANSRAGVAVVPRASSMSRVAAVRSASSAAVEVLGQGAPLVLACGCVVCDWSLDSMGACT